MLFIYKNKNVLRVIVFVLGSALSSALMAGGQLLQKDIDDISVHYGKKWKDFQLPVVWYLNEDAYPGSTFTKAEVQSVFQKGFDTWQALPESELDFVYGGETGLRNAEIDGVNLVTFTDQEFIFEPGTLAKAVLYTFAAQTTITDNNNDINGDGVADIANGIYPAGSIYEVDIVFNASYDFEKTGLNASLDLQAVALHEIGHLLGLSHSVVSESVMYPFLSRDVASARQPKADDVAYISSIYPRQPAYSNTYGSISGKISNGFDNSRILGAHVFALDPATGKKTVGAYSLELGDYTIPGLFAANYYIGIEPLNGETRAADPALINEIIVDTPDVNFPAEFYDNNESNIETDAQNAQAVSIVAGSEVNNIDIVTNTVDVPGVSLVLRAGLNILAYPVATSSGFSAFDLLSALGSEAEINSIDRYNPLSGRYQRTAWVNGQVSGENFAIQRGEAYLVHMKVQKTAVFKGAQDCPVTELYKGFNLVGVPCPPATYSAFSALKAMGSSVARIIRYNPDSAALEEAKLDTAGIPVGVDFPIVNGEGYVIESLIGINGVLLPGKNQLFPPFISGVSPGRSVIGGTVSILGQGFSPEALNNKVEFNGVRAVVSFASPTTLIVKVPSKATSGPMSVSVDNKTSNRVEFIVENALLSETDLSGVDLIDGQTVQGGIDRDGEQDRYTFIATENSLVSISANSAIAGIPDLILAIESPTGGIIASDNNSGGGTNPRINKFRIPATGRYTVVVTSVPDTGTGAYNMTLDILNRTSVPGISVLEGGFQSALKGSVLPGLLEIFVSGPTGESVAGASVTLIADDRLDITQNVAQNTSQGFTSASYTLTTNAGGIASVQITNPDVAGEYEIIIQVPGFEAQTISVASLIRLPAQVIVEGNSPPQDCGGGGCPVGQALPQAYKLRFLDSSSKPLEGILVQFNVVSGGGKLQASFFDKDNRVMRSDANGEVSVTHVLGTTLFDSRTGGPVAQIVSAVASIPNSTGPILFTPKIKAGPVSLIESLKSSDIQIMVGVTELQAIVIRATDEYGNPAANESVTINTPDFSVAPGFLDGNFLLEMKTDEKGYFAAQLTADKSGPTISEFRRSIGDKPPYTVNVSVGEQSIPFSVNVNLGPALVSAFEPGVNLSNGESVWVGKASSLPVVFKLIRFQRRDSCVKNADADYDEDGGDWRNEGSDIDLHELLRVDTIITPEAIDNNVLEFSWDIARADKNTDKGIVASRQVVTSGVRKAEQLELKVSPGDVKGEIIVNVSANIKKGAEHIADFFCYTDHDNSEPRYHSSVRNQLVNPGLSPGFDVFNFCVTFQCLDWSDPDVILSQGKYGEVESQVLKNSFSFNALSPRIELNLSEPNITEPSPDTLPGKNSYSGLDITDYSVQLNNANIINFDNINNISLGAYPNYIEIEIDSVRINHDTDVFLNDVAPKNFKFIYYPTATQLLASPDSNEITVDGVKDKTGNTKKDTSGLPVLIAPFRFLSP